MHTGIFRRAHGVMLVAYGCEYSGVDTRYVYVTLLCLSGCVWGIAGLRSLFRNW